MEINWDGAIQELQRRGRSRKLYENAKGEVCAIGAAIRAHGMKWDEVSDGFIVQAGGQLAPIVLEHFPERVRTALSPSGTVFEFNDDPRTTDDDVIMVMEKARGNATSTWTDHPGV